MQKQPKIVFVGDVDSGKRSILQVYTKQDQRNIVFQNRTAEIQFAQRSHKVKLWDTTGQQPFKHLRKLSYINTDLFMVVFNNRQSLNNAIFNWLEELKIQCPSTPILLVYNNTDNCLTNPQISQFIAKSSKATEYYTCEISESQSINRLFNEAAIRLFITDKTCGGCTCGLI